ncbi:PQQ-dependent sugar dehydrogenase [Mucilaginibacter sp. UR6-1]|uniref:PQQ-dependent sugar dehydrogenase n=1 Tax=Mucilaginibacter sp. UR6-1 TaxID=1435643 RepID=UPI001E5623DF|nr:PQQ-dependent sugar dehydrogenase [Mucilaginibacter sp. UR6-1]MCC8409449.1 PQQ-dependent sugar dehydrogenase [Mucilaginibacter sp. UR6-1]
MKTSINFCPKITTLLAVSLITLASCSKNNATSDNETNPTTSVNPVETGRANASYRPAFDGQTRISGIRTTTAIQTSVITSSLTAPWGIATLPDDRFLITEKAGNMRIVTSTGTVSSPITGFPAVNSSGQGGLLDVAVDPNFQSNRMIYWTYVRSVGGGNAIAVGRGRLSTNESAIESPTVIYSSTTPSSQTSNYGSRIIFDAMGNLLVSFGDRTSNEVRIEAQSVNSSIGKVIRITTNGTAAAGNPPFNQPGALPELYTIGHRNPQGLAIHPVTGDIWESEHGPRGGDEINRLRPGANYGWPVISYGIEYSGQAVGAAIQQQNGMEQPVYYWDPVVSPSGITFYAGSRIPEWQNNLFLCSLTQTHIIRLVIENNRVTGEERLLAAENQRFRDIIQGPDQALYAITDQGRLYRIDRQ